jgi:hypothetical protein
LTQNIYTTGMYEAVEKAGSITKLAAVLGVKRQAIYPWLTRGFAPPKRAVQIESLYGIPRDRLLDPAIRDLLSGASDAAVRDGEVTYRPRRAPAPPPVDDLV